MPKPGAAHGRLAALVGEWEGTETMHPGPWDSGGPATGRIVNRWIVDGFAVAQEYEQRRKGRVNFRGHGIFWYDQGTSEYVLTWWDSMGQNPNDFRGTFNGDVLELASPMPQGGRMRAVFDFSGANRYSFVMTVSPDGQRWEPAMEGRYRKSSAAPTPKAGKAAKRARTARPRTAAGRTRAAKARRRAGRRAR
jgi:hypothetical protein